MMMMLNESCTTNTLVTRQVLTLAERGSHIVVTMPNRKMTASLDIRVLNSHIHMTDAMTDDMTVTDDINYD